MMPSNKNIINYFFFSVICTVLAVHFVFDLKFKTELLQTGSYDQPVYKKPFYGYLVVPGTAHQTDAEPVTSGDRVFDNVLQKLGMLLSKHTKPNDSLGGDFSQVYFSAMALRHGDMQYNPRNGDYKDRFGRRPGYPPLTNWLYTPLTFLDYHVALTVHNFLSLAIFLGLALVILKRFKLQSYSFKFLALFFLLYFYTPLGLAHFERGQFDLWLASAYLLVFACIFLDRHTVAAALAAGFFGALKPSSAPFLGTISLLGWCGSAWKKRWLFVLPPVVMLLSVLLFYRQVQEYWPSIKFWEFQAAPAGVSFMLFLPRSLAKFVQICSCLIVIILSAPLNRGPEQRSDLLQHISFPFALTMFIQGMGFGTVSYEYRIVAIAGLVPGFLVWLNHVPDIPVTLKVATAAFFAAFIIIAFRVFHFLIWDLPSFVSPGMSFFYFLCSIVSLAFTCYLIHAKSRQKQAG